MKTILTIFSLCITSSCAVINDDFYRIEDGGVNLGKHYIDYCFSRSAKLNAPENLIVITIASSEVRIECLK